MSNSYIAVSKGEYIAHFNKNHSPKNGQFVSGDGDGDGITNDHKNGQKTERKSFKQFRKEIKRYNKKAKSYRNAGNASQFKMAKKIFSDSNLTKGQKAVLAANSVNWYHLNTPRAASKMIKKYRGEIVLLSLLLA